jgi:hypothetical protein
MPSLWERANEYFLSRSLHRKYTEMERRARYLGNKEAKAFAQGMRKQRRISKATDFLFNFTLAGSLASSATFHTIRNTW